jgi:cell division transport system permease protein
MLNKFIYSLKTAYQNIKNNIPLNLITATTITITLIIFVSFLLLLLNLSFFQNKWVDQIQIIVYLKNNIKVEKIEETRERFLMLEEVDSVNFLSKTEALKLLKTSLKGQDGILEALSENPLPGSLEIKLKKNFLDIDSIEQFVEKIKDNKIIEDIEYGQKWLYRFITFLGLLKIIGFVLGGFLFLFTLFIVSNTIKLTVYSRREEIEIMKLVGATNRFIKFPFFIEGIVQGLAGALFALFFLFLSVNLIFDKFISSLHFFLGTAEFVFLDATIATYVLLLGILLGAVGSFISLNSLDELKN